MTPPVPHWDIDVPAMHMLFAQQPLGQLVASQVHVPKTQR
jgi:hypothetical protein